jgi:transcriptional regulator
MADALPVVKGTLDVLVLKALSWGPMHGYEVTRWLEDRSGGTLGIEDSALYQAFYRLEERGCVSAEWGVTGNNRKARYYRVTSAGRAHLRAQTTQWMKYAETVSGILSSPARGS